MTFNTHSTGLRMKQGGQYGGFRIINGHQFKHLGQFNFRDGNRYFDARTNLSGSSIMYMFYVVGYLYGSGNINGWSSGYTYDPSGPTAILNKYTHNIGNAQIINTYRTSSSFLTIKCDRFSSGYTEGYLDLYFHTHDVGNQNACVVAQFAQNNTAGNHF